MKFMEDNQMSIFAIIGLLLLIPLFATVNGLLLMCLWGWFIVPLGAIPLTLPHAIGIGIIISLFKTSVKDKDLEKVVLENTIYIAVTFLFAYIVHLFM